MFQFFPFTNAHQLNLDWILETLKTFPRTVNNTYPDEEGNINLPTVAGMSSWNGIGADGAGNVDPAEEITDLDNAATGFHIYHWLDPDTANIPTDPVWFLSGEGYCFSCGNTSGYITQLALGEGGVILAIREKNPGYPWTSWQYFNNHLDIQSDIVIDTANVDITYEIQAKIKNGWCFGYFEGTANGILSGNMRIASGFPVPLVEPLKAHFTGIVKEANDAYNTPCRFAIDSNGDLRFDFLGNTEQAGDVIAVEFAYPIK